MCFSGDSHMRLAYNVFLSSLEGRPPTNVTDFEYHNVLPSGRHRLLWNPWGRVRGKGDEPGELGPEHNWFNPAGVDVGQFDGCSDVVLGHGQCELGSPGTLGLMI